MKKNSEKYPFYIIPVIEAYRSASGEEKTRLARRIAVTIGDPTALRNVLGLNPEEFANFYPDMMLPNLSTSETIDTFIDTFGDPTVRKKDDLDDILAPAAAPYDLSSLEDLPELPSDSSFSIPDLSPVTPSPPVPPVPPVSPFPPVSPSPKELAKIVKSGRYEEAMEIITQLNLTNPKKSIYFADQMRFLKKLIDLRDNKANNNS